MSRQFRGPAAPRARRPLGTGGSSSGVARRPRWCHLPSARATPHPSGRPRAPRCLPNTSSHSAPTPTSVRSLHTQDHGFGVSSGDRRSSDTRTRAIFQERDAWRSRPSLLSRTPEAAEAGGVVSWCWGEFSPALKAQETKQGPAGAQSVPPCPRGQGVLVWEVCPSPRPPFPHG